MSRPRRLGTEDEDRAAEYLAGKGYTILKRRYRGGGGEIDVLALQDEVLVCVEVKHRTHVESGAWEAVSATKLFRMRKAAAHFLARMDLGERAVRLDVIAYESDGTMAHLQDVDAA